ncbi:Mariner Mos1 transposase [Eumeta japonica]|uniref:Mariner Mos1 transposase n=1 Tax=Eumeta variegata TaxID=151549 RepID=A0A4C1YNT5_EUMVA|nr:Mariner Mos1 transposase [Eumeta japonica]
MITGLKISGSGQSYLKTLDWKVLPHPPNSPDFAPTDYQLFRSMAHALSEQRFTSYEDTKNWVDSRIASKDKEFFRLGIRTLPERWKKVVTATVISRISKARQTSANCTPTSMALGARPRRRIRRTGVRDVIKPPPRGRATRRELNARQNESKL